MEENKKECNVFYWNKSLKKKYGEKGRNAKKINFEYFIDSKNLGTSLRLWNTRLVQL